MHGVWDSIASSVRDVPSLRRRTNLLVAIHLVLAGAGVALLAVVALRLRVLVTLSQRSNVETLLIAIVVALVAYLLVSTASATRGSLRLVLLRLQGARRQEKLQREVEGMERRNKRAYLNVVVEPPGGGTLDVPIADDVGRLATLRLDGGEVALLEAPARLSSSTLKLAVELLAKHGSLDGTDVRPRIVAWAGIDEEGAERYGSMVRAFKRLQQALGAPLWPAVRLDETAVERLRETMRAATPYLREDVLLPDVEYTVEFRIPLIPEPLAFIQLRRRQEHSDEVAAMGCAALVVILLLAVALAVTLWPPWVPGK